MAQKTIALDPADYIGALENRVHDLTMENTQLQAIVRTLMKRLEQDEQKGESPDQNAPDEDDKSVPFSQSLDPSLSP